MKELELNIDVDVAFLAGQTPPVKVFPTQNTSNMSYKEQVSLLETDYLKYYSYRGDLKYNEKMARTIKKDGKGKCSEEETCMYRVCRDKNRFFETRLKDDVLILGKILESMIDRTAQMEKKLENVLTESGEKKMPNWDELFNDGADETAKLNVNDVKKMPLNNPKEVKRVGGAKRKEQDVKTAEQKSKPKRRRMNQSLPPTMTHEQAQMLVAQMMLSRSFGQANRIQLPADYTDSVIQMSNVQQPKEE